MIHVQDPACVYQREAGFHRFTFLKANAQAMDEFLRQFQHIIEQTAVNEAIPVLVDLRTSGLPPVGYAFPALKQFFRLQSQPRHFRAAYLHSRSTLVHIIPTFLNLVRQRSNRRFFLDEAEAVAWLINPMPERNKGT